MLNKKIWAKFQRIIKLFTQKLSPSSQKYGLGIRDPEKTYSGSRIQGSKRHRIQDPGVKKARIPDPQHWDKVRKNAHIYKGLYHEWIIQIPHLSDCKSTEIFKSRHQEIMSINWKNSFISTKRRQVATKCTRNSTAKGTLTSHNSSFSANRRKIRLIESNAK